MSKFLARYLKREGFWEVCDSASSRWYTAAPVPSGWHVTNGKTLGVVSSTGYLGRSIIAAVEAAQAEQDELEKREAKRFQRNGLRALWEKPGLDLQSRAYCVLGCSRRAPCAEGGDMAAGKGKPSINSDANPRQKP